MSSNGKQAGNVAAKRVLITGASGLLGRAITKHFQSHHDWEVFGFSFSRKCKGLVQVNLMDTAATEKAIMDIKPTMIIHSAAQRFPDKVDKFYDEAKNLNVESTRAIGRIAGSHGISVLYISTDYVFDGMNSPYKESNTPNPINKYGETKLEGEQALMQVLEDCLILRISVLYGDVEYLKESAVTCLLENLLEEEKKCKISDYEVRWPSHVDDIAWVCYQLSEQKLKDATLKGVFHWSGKESMTKYKMVQLMSEALNLPMDHIEADPKPSGDVTRPYNCQLDTTRLENLGMGHHTPFREGIKSCLTKFLSESCKLE